MYREKNILYGENDKKTLDVGGIVMFTCHLTMYMVAAVTHNLVFVIPNTILVITITIFVNGYTLW